MSAAELLALAERVEGLGDLTCPLCGETDFDVPGISMHWFRWCEVNRAVDEATGKDNAEVAAALRARAQAPQSPPRADAVAGVKEDAATLAPDSGRRGGAESLRSER